ncbi:MAG: hypothetical protein IPJ19_08985 [Planctomycetes bacterium]|nr:hypothetical protein [Planctomycetota bacterium]
MRLKRAFAALVAVERTSRAVEALAIAAASGWVIEGLARLEGGDAAAAARVPCLVVGALAGAAWMLEHWRDERAIALRADRVLATPQLLDTALEGSDSARGDWGEMLARRALARFDRRRLWLAAAPAWAATSALVLCAFGAHELLARFVPAERPVSVLAQAWDALAQGLEPGDSAQATAPSLAAARADLAARIQRAAQSESTGELSSARARELLAEAAAQLPVSSPAPTAEPAEPSSERAAFERLAQAYGRPDPATPVASLARPGTQSAPADTTSSGGGSGVPSASGEGTMGGSTESGLIRLPTPTGVAGAQAQAEVRPTLSARWWPRDQDGLVEAWIEHQQPTRSKR